MFKLFAYLKFRWAHLRWFWSGPNIILMRLSGADRESMRIADERHDALEPKLKDYVH